MVLIGMTTCLLVLVVLMQHSKKEGFGSALGELGAHQLIGFKKTGDLLEQITWGLGVFLLLLVLATSKLLPTASTRFEQSPNLRHAQQEEDMHQADAGSDTDTAVQSNGVDSSPSNPSK